MTEPHFLTLTEVLDVHAYCIEQHGGDPALLDLGLLESAIAQPRQGFGGQYFHPDLASMAAAYLFHIASNHAFADGNKRTAVLSAVVFLGMNGIDVDLPVDAAEAVTIRVASHAATKDEVIAFFRGLLTA